MKGARMGEVSLELAIQMPKALMPPWMTGQTMASTMEMTTDQTMTTSGTNRLPLKKDSTSGRPR